MVAVVWTDLGLGALLAVVGVGAVAGGRAARGKSVGGEISDRRWFVMWWAARVASVLIVLAVAFWITAFVS